MGGIHRRQFPQGDGGYPSPTVPPRRWGVSIADSSLKAMGGIHRRQFPQGDGGYPSPTVPSRRWGVSIADSSLKAMGGIHRRQFPKVAAFAKRKRNVNGGEGGIRTLDGLLTHTPLAGERLQPLGHLSGFPPGDPGYELHGYGKEPCKMARWEGFEPPTSWFVARCSIQLSYQRTTNGKL